MKKRILISILGGFLLTALLVAIDVLSTPAEYSCSGQECDRLFWLPNILFDVLFLWSGTVIGFVIKIFNFSLPSIVGYVLPLFLDAIVFSIIIFIILSLIYKNREAK